MLRNLEVAVTISLLLLFSGAWLHSQSLESYELNLQIVSTQSNPLQKLFRLLSYIILLFFISFQWKKFLYVLTKDLALVLLILTAVISVFWSVNPELTLEHSKGLVRSTLFGAYLATRYTLREQLKMFAWALGIAALLSIVIALILPSYGVHQTGPHLGLWRGVFSHKNVLGRTMNVSALVFALLSLGNYRHQWLLWTAFGLSVILIIFSGSVTALATLIFLVIMMPVYALLKKLRYKPLVIALMLFVLLSGYVVAFLLVNSSDIVGLIGKDPTISGRTHLWPLLSTYIKQNILLGYGYQAFWSKESLAISSGLMWSITHAHNGFIELLLGLGCLGFILFMLSFMQTLFKSIKQMYFSKAALEVWPLQLLLTICIIDSTIEATILSSSNLIWILYVSTSFSISLYHYHPTMDKFKTTNLHLGK